jgi:hypothetical protein
VVSLSCEDPFCKADLAWGHGGMIDIEFISTSADFSRIPLLTVTSLNPADLNVEITSVSRGVGVWGDCSAALVKPLISRFVPVADVSSGSSTNISLSALTPGIPIVVRVATVTNSGAGKLHSAWATAPYFRTPASTPNSPSGGMVMTTDDPSVLAATVTPPAHIMATGINGAPITGFVFKYESAMHARVFEVQYVPLVPTKRLAGGSFTLSFSSSLGVSTTTCLPFDASAASVKSAIAYLNGIDGVSVERASAGQYGFAWNVTFDGPLFSAGDVPSLTFAAGIQASDYGTGVACDALLDSTGASVPLVQPGVVELVKGSAATIPEVVYIETATTAVGSLISGTFGVSWDFSAPLTKWLCSSCFSLNAGSRFVPFTPELSSIARADIRRSVASGDSILLNNETFTVSSYAGEGVLIKGIWLVEAPSASIAKASAAIAANHVAVVAVTKGSSTVTFNSDSLPSLTSFFRENDYIRLGSQIFKVKTVMLLPNNDIDKVELWTAYEGVTTASVSLFRRQEAIVSASATADEMAASLLAAFPTLGDVNVERIGPSNVNSFRWILTLRSQKGASRCSMPGRECFMAYNTAQSPLLTHTLGSSLATVTSRVVRPGLSSSFSSASTVTVGGRVGEVQRISITGDTNDLSGYFLVRTDDGQSTPVNINTPAFELAWHLMHGFGEGSDAAPLGLVSVSEVALSSAPVFSRAWDVTFLTAWGDVPELTVDAASLQSSGTFSAAVTEITKGVAPGGAVINGLWAAATVKLPGVTPGVQYSVAMSAINSLGEGSLTEQNFGRGVYPYTISSSSQPSAPAIIVPSLADPGLLGEAAARVAFVDGDTAGARISGYRVDVWPAASGTGVNEASVVIIAAPSSKQLVGVYTLAFNGARTSPITVDSNDLTVRSHIMALVTVPGVNVTRVATNTSVTLSIVITGLAESGGALSIASSSLASGATINITRSSIFAAPQGLLSSVYSTNEETCGQYVDGLLEPCALGSAAQQTVVTEIPSPFTLGGRFRLLASNVYTSWIDVNATVADFSFALASVPAFSAPGAFSVVRISYGPVDDGQVFVSGIKWVIKFNASLGPVDSLVADGSRLTGADASIRAYPTLVLSTGALIGKVTGSVRLSLCGELTGPIDIAAITASLDASIVVSELEKLSCIGSVSADALPSTRALPGRGALSPGKDFLMTTQELLPWLSPNDVVIVNGTVQVVVQSSPDGNRVRIPVYSGLTPIVDAPLSVLAGGVDISIQLRVFSGDTRTFAVLPSKTINGLETPFLGFAARAGLRLVQGVIPRSIQLGGPAAIQALQFRNGPRQSMADSILLSYAGVTGSICISYGAPLADVEKAVNEVLVASSEAFLSASVSTAVGLGESSVTYEIRFYGRSKFPELPRLTVATSSDAAAASCSDPLAAPSTAATVVVRAGRALSHFSAVYSALSPATQYFVRVASKSERGWSEPSSPVQFMTPAVAYSPSAPTEVSFTDTRTGSSLGVHFAPPLETGGEPVLGHIVEWDTSPSFSSAAYRTTKIERSDEIQRVSLTFASTVGRSGLFTLSLGGATSSALEWDATTSAVASAVASLLDPNAEANNGGVLPVLVSRAPSSANGRAWDITFTGVTGDVALLNCDGSALVGSSPSTSVVELQKGSNDIFPGDYTFSVQSVLIDAVGDLAAATTVAFTYNAEPINSFTFMSEYAAAKVSGDTSALAAVFEAALESAKLINVVNVAAFVRSSAGGRKGVEWRVTFVHLAEERVQGAGNMHLLRLDDSRSKLYSLDDEWYNSKPAASRHISISTRENFNLRVIVSSLVRGSEPLSIFLSSLAPGIPVYGRVTAFNTRGAGTPSRVIQMTPTSQPNAVRNSTVVVSSDTSLAVSWLPPISDGGLPVSFYSVDWFASSMPPRAEVQTVTVSASNGIPEVQAIVLSSDSVLTGTFTLSFRGATTSEIPVTASAEEVKAAILRLPTGGAVTVTRETSWKALPGKWTLTNQAFMMKGSSDAVGQLNALYSASGSTSIKVAAGSAYPSQGFMEKANVFEYSGSSTSDEITLSESWNGPAVSDATLWVKSEGSTWTVTFLFSAHVGDLPPLVATPATGFSGLNAQLRVETLSDGEAPLAGTFALGFASEVTGRLPWNASATAVKAELEALDGVSSVQVTRRAVVNGFMWTVVFSEVLGDVPLLIANPNRNPSGLSGPYARVSVAELVQGRAPAQYCASAVPNVRSPCAIVPAGAVTVNGLYSHVISGLSAGTAYTVRVHATNAAGPGYSAVPSGGASATPRTTPGLPGPVALINMSDTSLKAVWSYPVFDGGAPVTAYEVLWSRSADMSSPSTARMSDSAVSLLDPVANVNRKIFFNIVGLTPSAFYYVQVRAINDRGAGAWASLGAGVARAMPPGPPVSVFARVISHAQIEVSWSPPDANLLVFGGDGGRPVTQYVVEWDSPSFSSTSGALSSSLTVSSNGALRAFIGNRNITSGREVSGPTALVPGATYAVRVAAVSAAGRGMPGYSQPSTVVPGDRVPSTPTSLAVTQAPSDEQLLAAWALPEHDGGSTLTALRVAWDVESDFSSPGSAPGVGYVDLPVVHAAQLIALEAPSGNEVQSVEIMASVANQVQTVSSTLSTPSDEVQTVSLSGSPVVEQVQTIETWVKPQTAIQAIEAGGNRVSEVQVITTGAVTRVAEVQVVRVSSADVDEVQTIQIEDAYGGEAAYTDLSFSSYQNANLNDFDAKSFYVNCNPDVSNMNRFVIQATSNPSTAVQSLTSATPSYFALEVYDQTLSTLSGADLKKGLSDKIINLVVNQMAPNVVGTYNNASVSSNSEAYIRFECTEKEGNGRNHGAGWYVYK